MIGVIAVEGQRAVIAEFFELFKTAWEFYRSERSYEVVLCTTDGAVENSTAKLVVYYAGGGLPVDAKERFEVSSQRHGAKLTYQGRRLPIYGACAIFAEDQAELVVEGDSRHAAIAKRQDNDGSIVRVGYDLFAEIQTLLTDGQPEDFAGIPTVELHISILRDLIVTSRARLVEVPPVPNGYRFVACLTHDIDHPSIRSHKWDHTAMGFLYRAVVGSAKDFARGRIALSILARNWLAALRLPFVYLGVAKDFWCGFAERYLKLEEGLATTYFVIPFKDCAGRRSGGAAPKFRAARYGANEIAAPIAQLRAAGCEVALHGIDAWLDSAGGRREFEEIRDLTKESEIGVRMHWLYFDEHSPKALEDAGALYDSTVGYREKVGYRAGTTQVYKPLNAERLLEVPLNAMDTALFYPPYMNLTQEQATALLKQMAGNAEKFGGCLTTNWHDRSLVPERAWESSYRSLIEDLKSRKAWFATVGQATRWFQMRRNVVFARDGNDSVAMPLPPTNYAEGRMPGLCVRTYNATSSETGRAFLEERLDAQDVNRSGSVWSASLS